MQTEPMKTFKCVKVLRKECEHFLFCVLLYILYGYIMALKNIASFYHLVRLVCGGLSHVTL